MTFRPFSPGDSTEIAGLAVETDPDKLSISGSADIMRDKQGLAAAQALRDLLDAVIAAMSKGDLPDELSAVDPSRVDRAPNPFG